MVVDCHAHLEPRLLDVPGLLRKMDAHAIARVVLIPRITDTIEPEKSEALLALQRAMMNSTLLRPLTAAVSRTFYARDGALRALWRPFTAGGAGYVKTRETDNASVVAALEKAPDRLWGWVFLNPCLPRPVLEELEQWRSVRGMIGIKVHPYWHGYPLTRLGPLASRAQELGLPVLVHLGFDGRGAVRWLLETYPALKVIFAHAAMPYYKALWPVLRAHRNAYVDLSSGHLSEGFARTAVRAVGAEKCLYGTDSPYGFGTPDGYDYGAIKEWIERMPVTARERDRMLGGNFLELVRA